MVFGNSEVFNKIAVLHLWPESLKNICKRVQYVYNFLQIGGDEEEDIEYEDVTEEEKKEEEASENRYSDKP